MCVYESKGWRILEYNVIFFFFLGFLEDTICLGRLNYLFDYFASPHWIISSSMTM